MLKSLFTFPYYHTTINPAFYNKDQLVTEMIGNYNEKPNRNGWNGDCDLHHSYNDTSQKDIDYRRLKPLYKTITKQFLKSIDLPLDFDLRIENYTVTTQSQSMKSHAHLPSLFSGIHYLKFDPQFHKSTIFKNPSQYEDLLEYFYPRELIKHFPSNFLSHWITTDIPIPDINEDDIVIFPSILKHHVGPSLSSEPRITVVFNIDVILPEE